MEGIKAGFSNTEETEAPVRLSIKGQIPAYIQGVLFRAGPGKFEIPLEGSTEAKQAFTFNHWFDGLTQMHKFQIYGGDSGFVEYSNKFTAKEIESKIAKTGKYPGVSFGQQDPCRSIFGKLKTIFCAASAARTTKVSNVGVVVDTNFPWPKKLDEALNDQNNAESANLNEDNRILVFTDANVLMEIDENLQVKDFYGYQKFDKSLKGVLSAAHSCIDMETNERYLLADSRFNFTLQFGLTPTYQIFGLGHDGITIYATIYEDPAYVHSFSLTKNYIIFAIFPYKYRWKGGSILLTKNMLESLEWRGTDYGTKVYLINRATKEVKSFTTQASFTFHHVNAFEDGSNIIFDVCEYEDAKIVDSLTMANLKVEDTLLPLSSVVRYKIDIPAMAINRQVLFSQGGIELPQINSLKLGKKYQFVYGVYSFSGKFAEALVKVNLESGEHFVWKEDGCHPGEPVFVPSPNGTAEDDGVILIVVLKVKYLLKNSNKAPYSFLLVLDASSMKELARADIPQVVGFGFHGSFLNKINQ